MATTMKESRITCDTEALNSVLRGEISAVETYEQAVSKFKDDPIAAELLRIQNEHMTAIGILREQVIRYGGEPSDGSGPWGVFATAVTGSAKLIGPETVLKALVQGEEHGQAEYQRVLDNDKVHPECKQILRDKLLPACSQHIGTLERIIREHAHKA